MKTINPYLIFDGNCEAAFKFYAQCLDVAPPELMRYSQGPDCDKFPAGTSERIMHACLMIGEQMLMASDAPPGQPYAGIKSSSVNIGLDNIAEAERLYEALSAGGSVTVALQQTFWADRFAMFTDAYGASWMINCQCRV